MVQQAAADEEGKPTFCRASSLFRRGCRSARLYSHLRVHRGVAAQRPQHNGLCGCSCCGLALLLEHCHAPLSRHGWKRNRRHSQWMAAASKRVAQPANRGGSREVRIAAAAGHDQAAAASQQRTAVLVAFSRQRQRKHGTASAVRGGCFGKGGRCCGTLKPRQPKIIAL